MANETLSSVSAATLSANTTLSGRTESANATYGNIVSSVEDSDSMLKNAIQAVRSAGSDGKFGMNVGKIDDMKTAIGVYISLIDNELAALTATDASQAFGPKIGAAVKDFVASIKNSTSILTSNLNGFKDDLTKIQEAYQTKESSVVNTVQGTATSINQTASNWSYSGTSSSN